MRIRKPRGERKTTCSVCDKEVEESRKGQRYCRSCHAANMRKNRPIHSKLKPQAKIKANSRSYANVYLNRGEIKKGVCTICGKGAEMHHEDYSKPLEVIWYCRMCHLGLHKSKQKIIC